MQRVEEILEIDEVVRETADRLASILERPGADALHPPDAIREMARRELELAAVHIGCLTVGSPLNRRPE